MGSNPQGGKLNQPDEPLIILLNKLIHIAVRALAILMTLVIFWGVIDVGYVLYSKILTPPYGLLTISDILAVFGAFMAVLIAIEIFLNITIYLKDDVIHVRIVMATALMAIARKIIILDFETVQPEYIWAAAAVILALSVGYWLIVVRLGDPVEGYADHQ
jgi:uncharacterized membrane protein (DUF373 family)